jgi:capsular polysaccharide transport system permease protein
MGLFLAGWFFYSWFTLALVMVLAPLSEKSDVLEKLIPVATYIMIPFSGTFAMVSWLTPAAQNALWWSPFVHAMEMMRAGIFGGRVNAIYDGSVPIAASLVLTALGLSMCRSVRRDLVVE